MSAQKTHVVLSLAVVLLCLIAGSNGRPRDICSVRPTISSVCLANTLAIVYDVETQHCKYMGCTTDKKIFATLEDCEKICNNSRHRRLRTKYQNKTNNINREE